MLMIFLWPAPCTPPSCAARMPTHASPACTWRRPDSTPGVVAVLTGDDILGKVGTIPCVAAAPGLKLPVQHALAVGKVGFVGQPVAVVVAASPATAHDAVEVIAMDVELLPAVVDPEQAAQPGAPKVHDDFDDNILFHLYGP